MGGGVLQVLIGGNWLQIAQGLTAPVNRSERAAVHRLFALTESVGLVRLYYPFCLFCLTDKGIREHSIRKKLDYASR